MLSSRLYCLHVAESDLDLELEEAEERPPPYEEVQHYAAHDRKETAI